MTNDLPTEDLQNDDLPTEDLENNDLLSDFALSPQKINFREFPNAPYAASHKYPTRQQIAALRQVRSVPEFIARVTKSVHVQYCDGGSIVVLDALKQPDLVKCPYCQQAQREERFRAQLEASGIAGRYADMEWNDLEKVEPVVRLAKKCEEINKILEVGACLLLYGKDTGTGKTQCAMLIGKAALRAGYTVRVVNLGELAVQVRASYGDRDKNIVTESQAIAQLIEPDLLILDDLGAGEAESLKVEKRLLYLALNARQTRRKSTICTSNMIFAPSSEEIRTGRKAPGRTPVLLEVLGERIIARLQPLTRIHFNHGKNFRTVSNDVSW